MEESVTSSSTLSNTTNTQTTSRAKKDVAAQRVTKVVKDHKATPQTITTLPP
ncbi:hypothetical protein Fmac_001331 [Flemingia macrophylla]|uniref:Uncharacterized protein n=1 Tax=Flemingia macrophylla TaxID=520843 RepID=A0ABD1NGX2_9FABA